MIRLSILVPSVSTRRNSFLPKSLDMLYGQLESLPNNQRKQVEILYLVDNKSINLGQKRNHLVDIAQGKYVVFVDDDDRISDDYIESILEATEQDRDCIVFSALVSRNGKRPTKCIYDKNFRQDRNKPGFYQRIPNHICAVKKNIVSKVRFSKLEYGEDSDYAKRLLPYLKTQHALNKTLYYYDFNVETSETYTRKKARPTADIIFISKALNDSDYKMAQNAISTCLAYAGYPVNIIVLEQSNYKYKNAKTIHMPGEFNYNKFANFGVQQGKADWAVIANNDLIFERHWLHRLLIAEHDLVSPHEPNDRRQRNLNGNETGIINGRHLSGWCYMIKRSLWEKIGGFDEDVQFWCSDDVVIEQALALGVKPMIVKRSVVRHLGSQTLERLPDKDSLKWKSVYIFNKKYKKNKFVGNSVYMNWLRENRQIINSL